MLQLEDGKEHGYNTMLDAELLWAMGRSFGDPGADTIHDWLTNGAPAGISRPIEDPPGNIIPPDPQGEAAELQQLPDHLEHGNYSSVDGGAAAEDEVDRLIKTGFVKEFGSHAELQACVSGTPHLSKLGMITKEKEGKIKRRLILDCKQSRVNELACSGGKLVLPRTSDAIDDALYLMNQCQGKETIEWLVVDFSDWFYNVLLHKEERKHFTWAFKQRWVAFLTQAQGSKNAPVVCGRVAAMIARMTQAVFGEAYYRLQVYVDDPCICVRGVDSLRNFNMAATILLWRTMGMRLAYRKASRGHRISWIGAELPALHQGTRRAQLRATAKQEIVDEIKERTYEHATINVLAKKALPSYVGKLNRLAGIVEFLRPFMADLYGVIHRATDSRAPTNCYTGRNNGDASHSGSQRSSRRRRTPS